MATGAFNRARGVTPWALALAAQKEIKAQISALAGVPVRLKAFARLLLRLRRMYEAIESLAPSIFRALSLGMFDGLCKGTSGAHVKAEQNGKEEWETA